MWAIFCEVSCPFRDCQECMGACPIFPFGKSAPGCSQNLDSVNRSPPDPAVPAPMVANRIWNCTDLLVKCPRKAQAEIDIYRCYLGSRCSKALDILLLHG